MGTTLAPSRPSRGTDPEQADSGFRRGLSRLDLEAALTALLVALGFLIGARPIGDNSFLTHLVTGQLIRDTGAVPRVDPYSWSAAADPWTVQSWLASWLYATVHAVGGAAGIRLFTGLLTALLAWGTRRLARRFGSTWLGGVAATALVLTIGANMWAPRPLLFGLLGALAVFWLALSTDLHPAWVVPIVWVWAQTHGSFPLALVIVVSVGLGRLLDERDWPRHELRMAAFTLGGFVAAVANPLGVDLVLFPMRLLGGAERLEGVAEWDRLALDRPVEWVFAASVALLVVALLRRTSWRLLVPGFVFALAGIWAVRNLAVASVLMIPAVAEALSVPSTGGGLDGSERSLAARALGIVAVALGAVAALAVFTTPSFSFEEFPVEAVDVMESRGLVGGTEHRILHRDLVGNYLIYRYGTEANVFVDDRFDFYPLDVLEAHRRLLLTDSDDEVSRIVAAWSPTAIVWETGTTVSAWLEDGGGGEWEVIHSDDQYLVAVPTR